MSVTIPNEVADVIEEMRKRQMTNEGICAMALCDDGDSADVLRSIPFNTLMAALINGYDREQTAEQRAHAELRSAYAKRRLDAGYRGHMWTSRELNAFANGIRFTLDTLGVKVVGVSDK